MKSFKDYKYTYVHLSDKVIALSTYAGKTVKGVAKCSPDDTFNKETGEKIAAARCNLKVSKRRARHAEKKLRQAIQRHYEAEQYLMRMTNYYNDSKAAITDAENIVNDIMKEV